MAQDGHVSLEVHVAQLHALLVVVVGHVEIKCGQM